MSAGPDERPELDSGLSPGAVVEVGRDLAAFRALTEDLAAIAAIGDPFERELAARAAIEVHRSAMARFSQLRAATVTELLRDRPGRAEDVADRLGVSREYLYAVAANRGKRK